MPDTQRPNPIHTTDPIHAVLLLASRHDYEIHLTEIHAHPILKLTTSHPLSDIHIPLRHITPILTNDPP